MTCLPKEQLSANSLRPYIETVVDAFGWDRIVWGGDWPVCNVSSSLEQWVSILDEILKNEDEQNLKKLYVENAKRIYSL